MQQESEWEAEACFTSIEQASNLELDPINRAFLKAAITTR
jgi:hypothetical protein|tara:strand:- start:1084 stop:1203 length:120 start_codon:yes stop_codon:yes gene_type:complete